MEALRLKNEVLFQTLLKLPPKALLELVTIA